MVALTNETQTLLSFSRTIKFHTTMCLNLIGESKLPKFTQTQNKFAITKIWNSSLALVQKIFQLILNI